MSDPTSLGSAAEELARVFHERYEQLAPSFGYETRRESAVPWDEVPEQNRKLMIAVCEPLAAENARLREALSFYTGNECGVVGT